MKKEAKPRWQKTGINNLVRHHNSKTYYARFKINGKQVWRSLETTLKEVTKPRLAELLENERTARDSGQVHRTGKMTIAEAIEIRRKQLANDPALKPSTKHYWNECLVSLEKTWPDLTQDCRKVTKPACEEWAGSFSRQASPTRFNNTLAALRTLMEIAREAGVRAGNPAGHIKRMRVKPKTLQLPTKDLFHEWLAEIDRTTGRFGKACGEYVRFLAFSGLRTGEAAEVEWRDCDFDKREIVVRGGEHGTKNSTIRRVPMIPALDQLLITMRDSRKDESLSGKVTRVREAKKSMDHAAEKVGIEKLTHHDLRHFFATICIESGVDIPTVSRWLGHKDGGALAMKTYGHLRNEHSLAQAQRVSFGGSEHAADVIEFRKRHNEQS